MQIHEITQKPDVNEGVLKGLADKFQGPVAAVKGIGDIALGGVNRALGTNFGGKLAGARVGPGRASGDLGIPQGKRLAVVNPKNNGTYYKTNDGWTTETGQTVSPNDSQYLEQLADQGGGKLEDIPPAATPGYRSRGVGPAQNASRVAKAARNQGARSVR